MPRYQQKYNIIEGLETLNKEELSEVIDMAVYACEKPITINTTKGYINYPLFYPAMENKGLKGFLKTKKAFPKDRFGTILSSKEIHHIIKNQNNVDDLIHLLFDTPIYAEAEVRKKSRGRPNKLLDAKIAFEFKERNSGMNLEYTIEGKNSEKSDQIMQHMPMRGLVHNLSVIERNFGRIQEYVKSPESYMETWEEKRPEIIMSDDYVALEVMEFLSDWYWQAKYDEFFWSNALGRPVDFLDPRDIVEGAVNIGRALSEMTGPALEEMGKAIAAGSSDFLEGVGDAIGGMIEGTTGMMKNMDSDDDGAAVVLLVIGGVALTALLATGIVYGGISLRREFLDYNLIWLDQEGKLLPKKSRLPLKLLKDQ